MHLLPVTYLATHGTSNLVPCEKNMPRAYREEYETLSSFSCTPELLPVYIIEVNSDMKFLKSHDNYIVKKTNTRIYLNWS